MRVHMRLLAILLPVLLLGLLAGAPAANAGRADFVVDTTRDTVDADIGDNFCADADGDCSLRAALQEANFLGGPDTIIVRAGTYELTRAVVLGGGGPVDTDADGDLDIQDTVTISGAGPDATIIDGLSNQRVFDIPITFDAEINISGLQVTNGDAGQQNGGGFQISGFANVAVNLSNVAITDSTGQYGGGIYIEGMARLTMEDSSITGSTAVVDGGGIDIFTSTSVTVRDSVIDGNHADSAAGIMNTDVTIGTLTVERSQITHNTAATFGGGIFNGAYASVTDSTISNNTATTNGGGGIYNASSYPLNVDRSTISNNVAGGENEGGGAIEQDSDGEINIVNSTIANNDVGTVGGAILIQDLGPVYITSSTIANNSGDGGIYFRADGTLSLADVIFENNGAKNCKQEAGVTADINSSDPYIADDSSCNAPDLIMATAGLQPLADNGGPTHTMAILADSPAVDAGGAAHCPLFDQRNAHRLDGDGDSVAQCDIGAFEFGYSVFVNGDLNCDDQLTPLDALTGLFFLAGLPAETGDCPDPGAPIITDAGSTTAWSSLNCDSEFTEFDITILLAATDNIPSGFFDCHAPGDRMIVAPAPSS